MADRLDASGYPDCANCIDAALENKSLTKVAQYVGAIGYVLKQNRALGNCIRKKRVANSGPMQEVVLDCLKEYQDGQDYHDTEWTSKYAQVIQQKPECFDGSCREYIKAISELNNIESHVNMVRLAQNKLNEFGQQDTYLDQLLEHYDSLESLV